MVIIVIPLGVSFMARRVAEVRRLDLLLRQMVFWRYWSAFSPLTCRKALRALVADGTLVPVARCVALLAGLRDGRLIARPSFFQLDNLRRARRGGQPWHLIVHEDVLIFRNPPTPGSSRELEGAQRELKGPAR